LNQSVTINKTNTEKIEILSSANSIKAAIQDMFDISISNYPRKRTYILSSEEIKGNLAFLYDKLCMLRREKWDAIAHDFIEKTNFLERPGIVIEAGVGPGYVSKALYRQLKNSFENFPDIWGFDSSPEMVKLCLRNNKNTTVHAVYGNIYQFSDFVNSREIRPSYIIFRSVLNRLKDIEKGLKKAVSILLPEGKIYIREILRNSKWESYKSRVLPLLLEFPEYPVEDFLFSYLSSLIPEEVVAILKDSGLHIIESKGLLKGSLGVDTEFSNELEFVIVAEKR